jgi:putative aminopeptidase FrvX
MVARRNDARRKTMIKSVVGVALAAGLAGAVAIFGAPKQDFDGARAFDLLKKQCDFGPRPVGTVAHEKTRDYLVHQMQGATDKVVLQDFDYSKLGKKYRLTNILGIINPAGTQKIMLSAHWDTRPTADQDKILNNRNKPILGANDGASGVAVLLELARVLKAKKPTACIYLMLFDGEDVGPDIKNMLLGARYFARHMDAYKPEAMILIDMIGDSDLQIYQEANSVNSDRKLVETVWSTAASLGYDKQFPSEIKYNIEDDHLPMQEAGVPSIDLIDFDYPAWHTLNDTVDKCSAESLEAVGRTLQAVALKGI